MSPITYRNTKCDGEHCRRAFGQVRVYSPGVNLCAHCFQRENKLMWDRAYEEGKPAKWYWREWSKALICS